jgi:beta-glucosidase
VNFFHFTHPTWFAKAGGILSEPGRADFLRYVEHVGRALPSHAHHFHVSNESIVYVFALHADAYRILKSIDASNHVATIEVYLDMRPRGDGWQQETERFDAGYNGVLLDALATGWIRPGEREPIEIPHLKGALDIYGFNYYCAQSLGPDGLGSYSNLDSPPIDSMGRAVFACGMEEGLVRVAKALPDVPVLVTENGCPTTDERFRIRYIAAHLGALDRARRRGVPVGGYFHWTAVDNYEWLEGFSDARFGLIAFDPHTQLRTVKESGRWLQRVITAGRLGPAEIP